MELNNHVFCNFIYIYFWNVNTKNILTSQDSQQEADYYNYVHISNVYCKGVEKYFFNDIFYFIKKLLR